MSTAIIEIANAKVFRGSTVVLNNLSLTLNQGEHIAILGPNGSGKSTLLKLLTRELYPVVQQNSYIKLFGHEHIDLWAHRSRIGVVSSELQHQYQALATGFDVVMSAFFGSVGIHQHHRATEKQITSVEQTLERFKLTYLRDKQFLQLSDGQQRRLLIARASVHKPELLVLDEPTSGLDIRATFQIIDDLQSLAENNVSLVLVTHHIQEIVPAVERVALLQEGNIVFDGSKEQALTSQRLSEVFDTNMDVSCMSSGFYQWAPYKPA